MDYKKIVAEGEKSNNISLYRYESSKIFLVGSSVAFFLNYLMVGNNFLGAVFAKFLVFSYALLLSSLGIFIFLFCKQRFEWSSAQFFFLKGILLCLGIILLIPFL